MWLLHLEAPDEHQSRIWYKLSCEYKHPWLAMFKYGQAWTSNLSKPENRHDLLLKYYLQELGTYGMQAVH